MAAEEADSLDFDAPNLAALMFARAARWPGRNMLRAHAEGGAWRRVTWGEFARQAASLARHLRRAGIAAGDRVLIVSENRPEVPIAEVALMAIRAVPVPAYTTNTVADHAHVLRDCGARVAIASTAALAAKVALASRALPGGHLDLLVAIDGFEAPGVQTVSWDGMVADALPPGDVAAEAAIIPASALACLIYTSGTGGEPKGVMLPHRAILANCRGALPVVRRLGLGRDELYLSFLPVSHAFEHTVGQFFFPALGVEVAYARGVEHLAADMLAVQPTLMTMVPRVLEVIRGRILAAVSRERRMKRFLFGAAMAAGYRALDGRASPLDRLLDPLWERLVRRRLRARFGGRFRAAVSGGARLEPEVGRFFLALGLKLLQGYGQTEAGPVISVNPPDATRIETVGRVLDGVELRIAGDGEILVRGELVMDGYWRRPAETAEVLRDGWLATGDVGVLDADGYLAITDRKKDMIVLSGGENVSPARIEGMLVAEPAIAQAMVVGEGSSGLRALVVMAEGHDEAEAAAAVSEVNKRLAVAERIRRHVVVPPFTHEDGLLTVTQKVRRHMVAAAYAEALGD
jgi:long-chain acyl-CoA synthetase